MIMEAFETVDPRLGVCKLLVTIIVHHIVTLIYSHHAPIETLVLKSNKHVTNITNLMKLNV